MIASTLPSTGNPALSIGTLAISKQTLLSVLGHTSTFMTILGAISPLEISTTHEAITEKDDDSPSPPKDKQDSKLGEMSSTWLMTLLSSNLPASKPPIQIFSQLVTADSKLQKVGASVTTNDSDEESVSALSLSKTNLAFALRLTPQAVEHQEKTAVSPQITGEATLLDETQASAAIGLVAIPLERPAAKRSGPSVALPPASAANRSVSPPTGSVSILEKAVGVTPIQSLTEPSPAESTTLRPQDVDVPITAPELANKDRTNNPVLPPISAEHSIAPTDPTGIVPEGPGLMHSSGESRVSTESAQTRKPEFKSDTNLGFRPPQTREILLRIPGTDANAVELRVTDRAGKVQVAVRSTDVDLTASLRTNLGELVGRLEDSGFETEVLTPMSRSVAPSGLQEQLNMGNPDGRSRGESREEQRPRNRQRRAGTAKVFSLSERGGNE